MRHDTSFKRIRLNGEKTHFSLLLHAREKGIRIWYPSMIRTSHELEAADGTPLYKDIYTIKHALCPFFELKADF